ncbi:hypothetical protein [Arundinibacter roseus]|uniref:DUF4190 domain-containing protein n=1 Tax=Arundinibacter roseus TaxID=2070510 RepID=A0A4R4KRF5_9BACT|nr:hypothetical protein [Arundinibacter roseus]TDB69001.1 hypothetical protein EZE20_01295 [Arundinibacter roseus]
MKKILLLLVVAVAFQACQKNQYPVINNPHFESYTAAKTAPKPAAEVPISATASVLTASASEDMTAVVEATEQSTPIPAEAITPLHVAKKTPAQTTWKEKVVAKKIQKKIEKAQSPEKAKSAKAKPDTVALLSLIFGGAGLLLLLAGTGLGLLLGLAGLVMGIVGLSKIRKGTAPASSRTMAILGVVFGGLVTLLGLIVIAAVASYGFV